MTSLIPDKELERLRALYAYEAALSEKGAVVIVGVDEVGRGPLAGPVSAGACVLDLDYPVRYLNDSKKVSPLRREKVAADLREHARAFKVVHVEASYIDAQGIMSALKKAFVEAVTGIGLAPDVVLLDGNPLHLWPQEQALVKGDQRAACIAAASILAKVERDALMVAYDSEYPEYGFASNKGYGSVAHRAAIEKYGLSPLHRRSFCGNIMRQTLF